MSADEDVGAGEVLVETTFMLIGLAACVFILAFPAVATRLFPNLQSTNTLIKQRILGYYIIAAFACLIVLAVASFMTPNLSLSKIFYGVLHTIEAALDNVHSLIQTLFNISALLFVFRFRDRIYSFIGIDRPMFRTDWRDLLTCWSMARLRPIEITIWKVQDLANNLSISKNDLYAEFRLGFNEPATTRVHKGVTSEVVFNENCQLNFDDADDTDDLRIRIYNQEVVGGQEVAIATLSAQQILAIEKISGPQQMMTYNESVFTPVDMLPRGRIWLRITPVEEEDVWSDDGSEVFCWDLEAPPRSPRRRGGQPQQSHTNDFVPGTTLSQNSGQAVPLVHAPGGFTPGGTNVSPTAPMDAAGAGPYFRQQ